MILNLELDHVGCIILGNEASVSQGNTVKLLEYQASVSVGTHLLGRVVDALGNFIDGKVDRCHEEPYENTRRRIEVKAPGVITLLSVS